MKTELFKDLVESVHEAGAVMRGERKANRQSRLDFPDVKAIRNELSLSVDQFARMLGVRPQQVRKWESGKSRPKGAIFILLRVAEKNPAAILEAVTP